jgi:predicted nucleic acid-binding protein
MIVIGDSDGLIGSLNPNDAHYSASNQILSYLEASQAKLLYPITVIAESVTFLQGRLNMPGLAEKLLNSINEDAIDIESVDANILKEASLLMNLKASKHHTLFDAIVCAVAEKHKADAIFSFDKFYKTKGFKLASDLK